MNLEVMARVPCSDRVLGAKTGENSGNIKYKDKNVERVLSGLLTQNSRCHEGTGRSTRDGQGNESGHTK